MNQVLWTPEKREEAIQLLTEYFKKHGFGECIMQSDEALIEAPELLSEIADEILIYGEGIIYIGEYPDAYLKSEEETYTNG